MPIPQDPEPDYLAPVTAEDLDPAQDPIFPTGESDDDNDDDVSAEPGGNLEEGDLDICPPPACVPARECTAVTLLEASWEQDLALGTAIEPFAVPQAVDWMEVSGEVKGSGGTVQVWQGATMIGSAAFTGGAAGVWTAWSVRVSGALTAGIEAEVRVVT